MTEPDAANAAYSFIPAGLRVEATWPEGCEPESMVVEINDRPVTGELVTHVVMTLMNARDIAPDLISTELSAPSTVEEGTAR